MGEWWQIAPNTPDVGEWATAKTNACDFAIFQSEDGKWHCIACVRGTKHHGERFFFHWISDGLTERDWRPVGIFEVERGMRGKPEQPTSVQAPHHLKHEGKHYLFYNSGGSARCMISDDGTQWRQHKTPAGDTRFFAMGRDVCVFHDAANGRWIAYYCGTVTDASGARKGAMVARTAPSPDGPWSKEEFAIKTDGNPESPFVIYRDGLYYLWQQLSVYVSEDPLKFDGAPLINHMTKIWYGGKWAPEILSIGDAWYIAGYGRGIHVARMKWERRTGGETATWREEWEKYLRANRPETRNLPQ